MKFEIYYNLFNSLEALLWLFIALVLFLRVSHIPISYKNNTLWGGMFFAIFGLSDIAEIVIGGIFAPNQYWLLAIKVICVITFVSLFVNYVRIRKKVGMGTTHLI